MHKCEIEFGLWWDSKELEGTPHYLCEEEDDGSLFIDVRDEYTCRVNFCPMCGYKAKRQVEALCPKATKSSETS